MVKLKKMRERINNIRKNDKAAQIVEIRTNHNEHSKFVRIYMISDYWMYSVAVTYFYKCAATLEELESIYPDYRMLRQDVHDLAVLDKKEGETFG